MKLLSLVLVMLSFVACNPNMRNQISGDLNVVEQITYNEQGRFFRLDQGVYRANITANSQWISIRLDGASGSRQINLVTNNNIFIPQDGYFQIQNSEMNQPFDIEGDNRSQIVMGGSRVERQQCIETRYVPMCRMENRVVCQIIAGRQVCRNVPQQVCYQVPQQFYGVRDIVLRERISQQQTSFRILETGSRKVLGRFNGQSNQVIDTQVVSQGYCRI